MEQLRLLLEQHLPVHVVKQTVRDVLTFLRNDVIPLIRLGYLRGSCFLRWLVDGLHSFIHARGVQDAARWLSTLIVIRHELKHCRSTGRLTSGWECALLHGEVRCAGANIGRTAA